jgi:hypothetical protein
MVPALAAAVFGVAALSFQEWRARHNAHVQRKRGLEEAQTYLTFLSQWFSTYEAIKPDADLAQMRAWAASALDFLLREVESTLRESRRRASFSVWERGRRALLLYPLGSFGANVVRVIFYLNLGSSLGAAIRVAGDSTEVVSDRIGTSIFCVLWAVPSAWGLWRWANRLARRRTTGRGG